jgi:uncharacterized protein YcbK (DUF882 family)
MINVAMPAAASPDRTPSFSARRRTLLLGTGAALASVAVPRIGIAESAPQARLQRLLEKERSLWLVRGNEQLRATYWSAERGHNQDEYLAICWALRDLRAHRVFSMDRRLLDVLAGLQVWLKANGIDAPLHIYSGYRTGRTNRATEGAALDSQHTQGKAVDITVPGVSNVRLAGMASALSAGGTGLYPGRSFVHVDTGTERIWIDRRRVR